MPRIAGEGLLRVGLNDIADETDSRYLAERIDESCREVGNEREVAELYCLEPSEVRAVESESDGEKLAVRVRRRNGQSVPPAEKIGELQVDELDSTPLYLGLQFRYRGKDLATLLLSMPSEDGLAPRDGTRARISNIFDAIHSIKD
jgi:hypothetical protein